ncbi:AtzH-like domain-containing protein [Paraburkholderia rhizosphaerae]|uniref:Uncharacterized protein DUF3225 n=1 Tax=Paraburkholderia rhizosphaerae TaxID=480658 RepID=A0A4R8LVE0_9BURK|nr:AtzH-like domain-containing protein [Paraburkholderia rhizosphaerae]TDY50795.1 uncharacterized protein DUF3225 [Paraburkholderia rhizosphaerae]
MNVNIPYVVAEVAVAHAAYEKALADNDIFQINALTWTDPQAVHYRLEDMHQRARQSRKLNASLHPFSNGKTAATTTITTFEHDHATVNTEFPELYGRRTVVWARIGPDAQPEAGLHGGWRVVASHESVMYSRRSF